MACNGSSISFYTLVAGYASLYLHVCDGRNVGEDANFGMTPQRRFSWQWLHCKHVQTSIGDLFKNREGPIRAWIGDCSSLETLCGNGIKLEQSRSYPSQHHTTYIHHTTML